MAKLTGTFTALITPFIDDQVDEEGLVQNIRFQIQEGISGIMALGTTGEDPTLTADERKKVVEIAVREANGKVPVIVGTGTNCTRETVIKTKKAQDLGADMALIMTPYYNRPTQEGIFRHFEAISAQVDLPVIVYNHPGRTGVNIETATLKRIASLPTIIGVKETSGNLNQIWEVINEIGVDNPDFTVVSGDDVLTYPMLRMGAQGVISVVSNLIPRQMSELVQWSLQGDFEKGRDRHNELLPFFKASCIESNPIPIKAAMAIQGMAAGSCRLPLCPLKPENLARLSQVLNELLNSQPINLGKSA